MCNINIFIKSKNRKNNLFNLTNFLNTTTTISYSENKDGDGLFLNHSNILLRSKNKLNLFKYRNNIKNSNFILSHQRMATSGFNTRYTQPLIEGDLIFLHNGIMDKYDDKIKSDSQVFFNKLIKIFHNSKKKTRQEKITSTLQKLLNKEDGSFSIALFDMKENNLYYVKNDKTNIYFFRNKNKSEMFISTKNQNTDVLISTYNKNFEEVDILDFKIYKISINKENKIVLQSLKNIEEKEIEIEENKTDVFGLNSYNHTKRKRQTKFFKEVFTDLEASGLFYETINNFKPFKEFCGFIDSSKKRKCNKCLSRTLNRHINTNAIFCDFCIDDERETFLENNNIKINNNLNSYC